MCKIFFTILYIFYVLRIDSVDGAAFIIPSEKTPPEFADQEGCYLSELNRVLPYNKPFSPQDGKSCVQYTCNSDNTTSGYTCGAMFIAEPCTRVPGNLFLPYPQCCDGVSCPKQPSQEDPDLEKIPEEEDQAADLDPPVGPTRPCPTCPYPPVDPVPDTVEKSNTVATDYPGTEKLSHTEESSDTDGTSDFEVVYIPPNAPHAPICGYVIHSLSGVRDDIPPYCLPIYQLHEKPVDNSMAKPAVDPTVDPGREPVIGPVAQPIEDPAVGLAIEPIDKPVNNPVVDPEPELKSNDTLPMLKPPTQPPIDPICAYSDESPEGTSIARPPYCPPLKDLVPPPVIDPVPSPPKRPSKPAICYYPTTAGDSANAKLYCPPRPDPVLAESQDEPSNLSHQPVRTLPVQPPADS
ncbi:hypothetical protein O0L34_g5688 [Tuta absoluta]|nr:hypothetical protein O0L34_g5688 [Tuta absoluta]